MTAHTATADPLDHWRDEPLFDLVGVCHACHDKITQMDRRRRGVVGV